MANISRTVVEPQRHRDTEKRKTDVRRTTDRRSRSGAGPTNATKHKRLDDVPLVFCGVRQSRPPLRGVVRRLLHRTRRMTPSVTTGELKLMRSPTLLFVNRM